MTMERGRRLRFASSDSTVSRALRRRSSEILPDFRRKRSRIERAWGHHLARRSLPSAERSRANLRDWRTGWSSRDGRERSVWLLRATPTVDCRLSAPTCHGFRVATSFRSLGSPRVAECSACTGIEAKTRHGRTGMGTPEKVSVQARRNRRREVLFTPKASPIVRSSSDASSSKARRLAGPVLRSPAAHREGRLKGGDAGLHKGAAGTARRGTWMPCREGAAHWPTTQVKCVRLRRPTVVVVRAYRERFPRVPIAVHPAERPEPWRRRRAPASARG
jgi:hypothetical protein